MVTVNPDGNYVVRAVASEENGGGGGGGGGTIQVSLVVTPAAGAYFPGATYRSDDFVSGYTVPGLRASATGQICVSGACEQFENTQSYHDHNWGVWRGVTWDWGASRAGSYTILYGRVIAPERRGARTPLLVYLVDSLGFRSVFRPSTITYEDNREIVVGGRRVRVPTRAVFTDARGDDTLRVELSIEDAIGTDTRSESAIATPFVGRKDSEKLGAMQGAGDPKRPYFIQMKGITRLSGRVGGAPIAGIGSGFFESYR
jgi:hypothetical protein